jgi:hypothetical protein
MAASLKRPCQTGRSSKRPIRILEITGAPSKARKWREGGIEANNDCGPFTVDFKTSRGKDLLSNSPVAKMNRQTHARSRIAFSKGILAVPAPERRS